MRKDTFGAMLKKRRIEKGDTLRRFCVGNAIDVGNYSKIERGELPPPSDPKIVCNYIYWLGLNIIEARQLYFAAHTYHIDKLNEKWTGEEIELLEE